MLAWALAINKVQIVVAAAVQTGRKMWFKCLHWTNIAKPGLLWLKKACPSAYTYPFDDMSSTFTCRNMINNINSVNY